MALPRLKLHQVLLFSALVLIHLSLLNRKKYCNGSYYSLYL